MTYWWSLRYEALAMYSYDFSAGMYIGILAVKHQFNELQSLEYWYFSK